MTGGGVENTLISLFDTPTYQLLAVVLALGVGAAHAVAPGHGKGITAAYLIGAHGRYRDAAYLGGVVAGMHTFSALVLALAWVNIGVVSDLGTERITQGLQVLAGVVIVGVGVHLVRRRHSHHHHHHHHHHGAGAPSPWSRKGLLALGLSGGLMPSPSAFMVLVSGLLTGRVLFAVVLVLMFGLGMACTLTGVGVATLKGTALIGGRSSSAVLTRMSTLLPRVAAYGVVAGGLVYLTVALTQLR